MGESQWKEKKQSASSDTPKMNEKVYKAKTHRNPIAWIMIICFSLGGWMMKEQKEKRKVKCPWISRVLWWRVLDKNEA